MASQMSTSVSDLVLALSALHATFKLFPDRMLAAFGFLLIGMAASVGVVRFALKSPSQEVVNTHQYLSGLASTLGMSLLAAAYHRAGDWATIGNTHLACGLTLIIVRNYFHNEGQKLASEAVSAGAVVSILLLNLYKLNAYGIIGAVSYVIAGQVVGTEGSLHGIPRVDVFHYILVIGNIALLLGLSQRERYVYYHAS